MLRKLRNVRRWLDWKAMMAYDYIVSISHPGLNERNHRANKPRFQTLVLTNTHELFGSRWVLSLRPIRGSSVWKWGRSMRCNILKQLKQCCSKAANPTLAGDLSSNPVMSRLLWVYWRKILEKTWKKLYRQTKRPPSESIMPAASWASWATSSWATMAYIALKHRRNGWDWGCVVAVVVVAFTLLFVGSWSFQVQPSGPSPQQACTQFFWHISLSYKSTKKGLTS